MAFILPKIIAIRTTSYSDRGHLYYKEEGGSVGLGEQSVLSTLVKIEVERAKINNTYVHLRFSHSNRYWAKSASNKFVVAESKQPEEDASEPSCTLFQALQVAGEVGVFYLNHVQSGGRLLIDRATWTLYVEPNSPVTYGHLTYVDWSTLVKLPRHVAFKGDNDRYLRGLSQDGRAYLQFSSNDPNERSSGHWVWPEPDGRVRIKSDHWGNFWRLSPNWIWADSTDSSATNPDTVFVPVKVDDGNTIALRNAGNNLYCKRLTTEGKTSALNAAVNNITNEARLVVQELVSQRNIYNVQYRMQDARIYDEVPYVAGTSVLTNTGDQEAAMGTEIVYQDEKSYTFSRSLSLTAGVTTTFQTGVPFIVNGKIKISFEINTTLQWDTTTTSSTTVKATGSVVVPAKSTAVIDYVGTKGKCDVPYDYTQQDRSSTDGQISYTEEVDGIYKGVNSYNFNFVIRSLRALV